MNRKHLAAAMTVCIAGAVATGLEQRAAANMRLFVRRNAPSNRPAASWCDPKSAVCTTATNGKPPDRVWLRWACDGSWTWRSACELIRRHLQTEFDA